MNRKYLILSLLTIFFLASCSKNTEPIYQDGQGGVKFTLSSVLTDTKSDARDANIDVNDFMIEIINSQGVTFKRWKTYSAYLAEDDQTVLVNAGTPYTIRATYGDSTAVGFDAFYFKGEKTFTVEPQTSISVDVVCKQSNVEVAVVYGSTMAEEYSDYSASVKHVESKDSLFFAKDETESGYIRTGDLKLFLNVIDRDGISRRYGSKTPYSAEAGDSVTFTVNTVVTPDGVMSFDISINSTTIDTVINVPIDSYMLSKDAPKFVPEGFNVNSGILSYVEGLTPDAAAVNINAAAGIASCTMKVNSTFLKSLGWPDEVDFFNIPSDVKAVLDRDGLLWTSSMKDLTLSNVDFKKVAQLIQYSDAASADNSFTFSVTDNSGKIVSATYILSVIQAQLTISDINDYDVWSSSLPVTLTTTGDPLLLYPVVKPDGGSWVIPSYTYVISGNSSVISITGLTPGTVYTVRGAYYNGRTENRTITTETVPQVGNSGFENFYRVESQYTFKWGISYTNDKVTFYPYSEGDTDIWWDTNNAATTVGASTPGYQWAKCFPTVNYTETSVHGGSKAAQVRSVAVNDYNSAVATTGGKTQGKLFCSGHAFPSRPTEFQFYYKYESYNSDTFSATMEVLSGDTVIGTATFTNSPSVSAWALASAEINYTDLTKKATAINITFLSSTNTEPDVQIQKLTILDKSYSTTHTGSCITLDDINLVYGK